MVKLFYFSEDDGSDEFLYSWDGTNFTKIVGGSGSAPTPDDPYSFVVYNGVLYFSGDGVASDTLHSWDGSIFTAYGAPPFDMIYTLVYEGVLYFNAESPSGQDTIENLWSLRPAAVLADTGVDASIPLGLAGTTLIAGALALLVARRRSVLETR